MRTSSVHQSVARATGESARLIRRMGFSLIVPPRLGPQKAPRQAARRAVPPALPAPDSLPRSA